MCTFEEALLKKAFFSGEHKLDRVLLSLLHLKDARDSIMESSGDQSVLINTKNFAIKIRQHANKSLGYHFKKSVLDKKFSYSSFALKYGIPFDTINGIYPLRFKNARLLFHSLKLSYALYLTTKMFKVDNVACNQRKRGGQLFLERTNLLTMIFMQVYTGLAGLDLNEKQLIKCMKSSLCLLVSKAMDQVELPEGDSIRLFPCEVEKSIRDTLGHDDWVRFAFSCLQSKVLCEEVPEDFILDTLIKHREQLSSPHRGLDPQTLNELRERGRDFGVHVAKYYKARKGHFPTTKASFQFPRNKGGMKGDLVFHDRMKDLPAREDPDDRMEPMVIGLFGQPGSGKSSKLSGIIAGLAPLFPGVSHEQLTYQRTCHVDHWDGYFGQPIVIFDDIGQATDGSDIKEFQTLISCCPYVLPMAHLDNKGMKFNSPIVITTSNLRFGSDLLHVYGTNNPIIDDASFWRRFHVPLTVEDNVLYELKTPATWVRNENKIFKSRRAVEPPTTNDLLYYRRRKEFDFSMGATLWQPHGHVDPSDGSLTREHREDNYAAYRSLFKERCKHHDNFRSRWVQTVVDKCQDTSVLSPLLAEIEEFGFTESFDYAAGKGGTKCLSFPAYPPPGPLPVRVEPIPEPLKVRTITAGKADTFCLKPLQRAMWLALGDYPQFCLTHGTNRLEEAIAGIHERSDPEDVWISGDYTAATDSFAIEGSKALLEGILESIDHEPTRRWAMKEISAHLLVYPKSSGLKPVLQRSGQLMGSLLSFPLLCLLNDCTAQNSGVASDKYLINGDDILMRAPRSAYPKWKEQVQKYGLDLSPGKNYIHEKFGTVNSQLIVDGRVSSTGKQKVLDRRSHVLGECLRDLEFAMQESPSEEVINLFKSVNRSKLSRTVRDIYVPVSHGGLSFSWGPESSNVKSRRTAKLCYLHDMFKKIETTKGCISIPYLSLREQQVSDLKGSERIFNEPASDVEYHEDFLSPIDLQHVQKRCMTNSHLRELLLDQDLKSMPSLSFLRTYQIPCSDVLVRKSLQNSIDTLFLRNFLQGGQNFGYDTYRREFLLTTMNLKSCAEVTVKHLVSLMDLDVAPDFIHYLNLDYNPTGFSRSDFELQLGKALRPNQFTLPDGDGDFEDFSLEVDRAFSFKNCIQAINDWGETHELKDSLTE